MQPDPTPVEIPEGAGLYRWKDVPFGWQVLYEWGWSDRDVPSGVDSDDLVFARKPETVEVPLALMLEARWAAGEAHEQAAKRSEVEAKADRVYRALDTFLAEQAEADQ